MAGRLASQNRNPNRTLLCFCFASLLIGWANAPSGAEQRHAKILLATGEEGGTYYKLGRAIADRAAVRDLDIEVIASGGSVQNIELLRSGRAQFALVQSDVAHQAARGHRPFDIPSGHLTVVASLYTEAVQILVRSHLFIFTPDELKGKVVSIGSEGSGTEQTARAVLEASGISLREVDSRHLSSDQIGTQLNAETIDAAFLTSAVPTSQIETILSQQEARLLPLQSRIIERLVADGRYLQTSLPKGTYSHQTEELPTAGVRALLLCLDNVDSSTVTVLLEILRQDRRDIERRAGVRLDPIDAETLALLPMPLHPTARRFLAARGVRLTTLILFLSALALVIFGYLKRVPIRQFLKADEHQKLLRTLFVPILIWLAGSGGLYFFERRVNENFNSFWKSALSVIVYVARGFQTRAPLTRGGEVVAALVILFGAALIAWLTAELATHFVKDELLKVFNMVMGRKWMPKDLKDHIVIVNWDPRASEIVKQLHGPDFAKKRPIVVISETELKLSSEQAEFPKVFPVTGDPTTKESLLKARVHHAHSVTILSTWPCTDPADRRRMFEGGGADSKTVICILAIRTLCQEQSPPANVPITAEIRSSKSADAVRNAGRGADIEIICVENFGADILAQCALTPGLATLYEDLLTFARGTSEVYKSKVPAEFEGKTFSDLLFHFAHQRQSSKEAAIPIAVRRGSKLHLNPLDNSIGTLQRGDDIFVISDHEIKF